jgi:phosphotransferase system enzyme I (PtsI)
VLLDGTNGVVTIEADAATVSEFEIQLARQRKLSESETLEAPAGTFKDGGSVSVCANVHPGVPLDGTKESGARGIGLYRSEYLWLNRGLEPTEEEQFIAYREVAEYVASMGEGASATIRVLDVGGDKVMRGISVKETNPFLGNRSIRYLLSNPDTMRKQIRAILRASAYGRLRMMYPMVSCVEELDAAAVIFSEVKRDLDGCGIDYDRDMPVGMMIEVPSAAINAGAFARKVDFFSVGTNDLVQYVMAADRDNEAVAHLYQPANPAILKLMANVACAAEQAGIEAGVCGASAADPVLGTLWAAMGFKSLSMSVPYIRACGKLFARLSRTDLDEYRRFAENVDPGMPAGEVYEACRGWLASRVADFESTIAV